MPSVSEASDAKTPLGAALAEGVKVLSLNQQIVFTQYVKVILPLDGFVFWVKAEILSPSALLNAFKLNSIALNAPPTVKIPASTITVDGSLHYSTDTQQNEDETVGINAIVFTALEPIVDFNSIGPGIIYIASLTPDGVKYAFNGRAPFYEQADLHHYYGNAVYPAMLSQIIDDPAQFDSRSLVVSNSLPMWLQFNGYEPPYPGFTSTVNLYPSFAVPDNTPPPYGVVHISPESTKAIQSTPRLGPNLEHWQLVSDLVRVTFYGLRNDPALTFLDTVNQYSRDTDNFGIMNMPVIRDEKRTQSELNILAMKKTIEFEISYYQATSRSVARQLILSVINTKFTSNLTLPY